MMGYIPFWVFTGLLVILAITAAFIYKVGFIDIQAMILVIAAGFILDMVLSNLLGLFYWVSIEHQLFYSMWACLLIYPSTAFLYLKLLPVRIGRSIIYTLLFTLLLTLLELFILKPLQIVQYPIWRITPWSPIGYIFVLICVQFYYRLVIKRINGNTNLKGL